MPQKLELVKSLGRRQFVSVKEYIEHPRHVYFADQLNDFTGNFVASLESKLSSLDSKVATIDDNLAGLSQRAHAWDTFEHHVDAWNSQITSLDQKIEHLRR